MKVSLRKKLLKDGKRHSLYLDIYPPPPGCSRYEFLKLYIFSSPRSVRERSHNRDTLQIAEDIRAVRHKEVNEGRYKKQHPGTGILFEEWYQQEARRKNEGNRSNWLKAMTRLKLTGIMEIDLADLDAGHIVKASQALIDMSRQGTIRMSSAQIYWQHVRAALRSAYRNGLILEQLWVRAEPISGKSKPRRALTKDELNALIRTPCKRPAVWQVTVFAALTGLRISDIRALRWETVYDTHQGAEIRFRSVKTGEDNSIPLSDQARTLIGNRQDGLVFPYIPTTPTLLRWLRTWADDAGINNIKGLTFHSMRHTFATLMLSEGSDVYTVSKLLGHASVKTTEIYAKIVDKQKREAVNRLVVDGDVSAPPPPLRIVARRGKG